MKSIITIGTATKAVDPSDFSPMIVFKGSYNFEMAQDESLSYKDIFDGKADPAVYERLGRELISQIITIVNQGEVE